MVKVLSVILVMTCFLTPFVEAEPVEWHLADGGNGHFYDAIPSDLEWEDAKLAALSLEWADVEGHLATITSAEENQFIIDNVGGHGAYWLGGIQLDGSQEPEGGWTWVTGEPWGFTYWHTTEPNNDGGEKYLMTIWWNETNLWNDENYGPYSIAGFFVEYDATSTSDKSTTWSGVKSLFR